MNCRIKGGEWQVASDDTDHHASRIAHHAPRNTPPTSRITHHASRITPLSALIRPTHAAFSLMEVMIASFIFFMAIFAILAMISNVLRNARSLRRVELDAGMVAAQLSNTNKLTEGTQSGDFGNIYQDYSWEADQYEIGTNGLWQVDIVVHRRGLQKPADVMSIWLFRPESKSGIGPRSR